jgi:hypothetical protein
MALPAIWRKFAAVPSPALPPVLLTVIARTLKNAFIWFVQAITLSLHCCIEVGESEASDLLPGHKATYGYHSRAFFTYSLEDFPGQLPG